ncbi:enoyl-CoA hydratase/isomerase [Cordyceps militaris CM01]|uniref:Enoyl-CoA hydratase/isomerase n=1 Tax=Cordyceps militaris (strain CM01) TaxID=983644 RepID=G3JTG3_CORMM|nr:enoyl-CoA hydratase/isomerase [Cordyceps militaris CM01]EGX87967.1 enoyl-CoA hydratase/isomerase [Cordyceps militaris CM01]
MSSPLFSVPIGPCGKHPGGTITCTEPRPQVYLLTWNSPPDNRLTTPFCKALLAALDVLEFGGYAPGVVVTTSSIAKNYSNGFDLEHTLSDKDVFFPFFYGLWVRFLTYPMPTVALMNGHGYAAGLMLAMAHDYRLAPTPRGFFCLPELTYGLPLTPAMASLFRHKLSPAALRDLALEAGQLSGQQIVDMGVADALAANQDDAWAFIAQRKLAEKAKSGVYGVIKGEVHKELIKELRGEGLVAEEKRHRDDGDKTAERVEFGKVWYEQWKAGKARL